LTLSDPASEELTNSAERGADGTPNALIAQLRHLWHGDSGMIPIVIGLAILVAYFQIRSSVFLSAGNVTNLFIQATVFILLGMAEIWLLLLGEIDLSLGFVAALGGATSVILTDNQFHWPWYAALLTAVLVTTAISTLQGIIVIGLKLPSFIVTLAGLLFWQGVLIFLIDRQGTGGTIPVRQKVLYDLVNGDLTPLFTWIFVVAVVAVGSIMMIRTDRNRRAGGLETRPMFILVAKIVSMAVAAGVIALVFNTNRGVFSFAVRGMPFAIPIDFAVVAIGSFILIKTKAGRYIYAIGGNTEAARRAGVKVSRYRLFSFAMTGVTAGIAGLLYVSQLGGISDGIPGGTQVLYAVAAAVIGGTSLFGGRGKMVHAVIGGIVIATIYNGMALIGMSAATQYMATALVLLAAVTIDSLARRGTTETR
jgi:D-xylose transport system permease protein